MHKNQLNEYFFVLALRYPNNRLIITVREKRPKTMANFELKSMLKNTSNRPRRSRALSGPGLPVYEHREVVGDAVVPQGHVGGKVLYREMKHFFRRKVVKLEILSGVMGREGIEGEGGPAADKEFCQGIPDRLIQPLHLQIEHAAEKDIVEIFPDLILFRVKDPEMTFWILPGREGDQAGVYVITGIIHSDSPFFQELVKIPFAAAEIKDPASLYVAYVQERLIM